MKEHLPIDTYISKLGPFYATRREIDIVGHLDVARVLVPKVNHFLVKYSTRDNSTKNLKLEPS